MHVYVVHSKNFDYKKELYEPIRNSPLNNKYIFIFPHETDIFVKSKDIIKNADLIIAEVSFQATGSGIELGWAESFGKQVICVYKKGSNISGSLKAITDVFIEYLNKEDLVIKLHEILPRYDKQK